MFRTPLQYLVPSLLVDQPVVSKLCFFQLPHDEGVAVFNVDCDWNSLYTEKRALSKKKRNINQEFHQNSLENHWKLWWRPSGHLDLFGCSLSGCGRRPPQQIFQPCKVMLGPRNIHKPWRIPKEMYPNKQMVEYWGETSEAGYNVNIKIHMD